MTLDDFPRWKKEMECLLTMKKLKAYITRLPLEDNDEDAQLDDQALAYITIGIDNSLRFIIDGHLSSFSAWRRLNEYTANNTRPLLMNLLDQIQALKQKGGESMQDYWARAMKLRDQLASAGNPVDDVRFAHTLIKGLLFKDAPSISSVIGIYKYDRQPPMSIETLRLNLMQAETDMDQGGNSSGQDKALVTIQKKGKSVSFAPTDTHPISNVTCFYCHKKGHVIAQCRKRKAVQGHGHLGNRNPGESTSTNHPRSHVALALASITDIDTMNIDTQTWLVPWTPALAAHAIGSP